MSRPNIPDAVQPIVTPPDTKKKLELNPALTKSNTKKSLQVGTRKLQIPLGGTGGGTGLNVG